MGNQFPRDELIAVVDASPKAVSLHDKQAWLSIFAQENIVEDPVGSAPHCTGAIDRKAGKFESTPLERFYETFIAPNNIAFHVDQDIVAGNTVIRDLTIVTTMSGGLAASVPMHLFYELNEEDGALKIRHLSAHWELPAMIKQVMSHGLAGLYTMMKLGIRMMKYQGVAGALGFSKGFWGIHQKGKDAVRDFAAAAGSRNPEQMSRLFCSNNTVIGFPAIGEMFTPNSFLDSSEMNISVSKEISAGFITTFTFDAGYGGNEYHGVGRFEFDPKSKKIKNARFFWDGGEHSQFVKTAGAHRPTRA